MFFLGGSIQIVWRPDLFAIIHIFIKLKHMAPPIVYPYKKTLVGRYGLM